MRVSPLFNEEAAQHGANLVVEFDHTDLTEATANTAQVLPLFDIKAPYQSAECVRAELIQPFKDSSDTSHNSTAIEIGDDGDVDRLLVSQQVNENGTEITMKDGTRVAYVPTADNTVDAKVTAMAGKNLAALTHGKWRGYFKLHDSRGN